MEKKLFAVKLEPREKDAMESVARATGSTLSALHMEALRGRAHSNLGYVLLHSVHGETVGPEEMALFVRDEREAFRRRTPKVLLNLSGHVSSPENAGRLAGLLPLMGEGPSEGGTEAIIGALDAGTLTRRLGEAYLDQGGPLDRPDPAMILDIAAREILESGYRKYARGSMEELSEAWEGACVGLVEFRRSLVQEYLAEHRPRPVNMLPPGRPERAPGKPSGAGRGAGKATAGTKAARGGKGPRGGKRPRRSREREEEEVEVVEVAPVVEVDELDE